MKAIINKKLSNNNDDENNFLNNIPTIPEEIVMALFGTNETQVTKIEAGINPKSLRQNLR